MKDEFRKKIWEKLQVLEFPPEISQSVIEPAQSRFCDCPSLLEHLDRLTSDADLQKQLIDGNGDSNLRSLLNNLVTRSLSHYAHESASSGHNRFCLYLHEAEHFYFAPSAVNKYVVLDVAEQNLLESLQRPQWHYVCSDFLWKHLASRRGKFAHNIATRLRRLDLASPQERRQLLMAWLFFPHLIRDIKAVNNILNLSFIW